MRKRVAPSRVLVLLAAAAISLPGCRSGRNGEEVGLPPSDGLNVLVVSFDALRADALPLYGYGRDTAPTMTAFGHAGIVFDRAYAAGQATPTSFAGAFSGRHPFRSFLGWTFTADTTLASVLSGAGYETAFFSSNIQLTPERGFGQGFGTYRVLPPDKSRDEDHDGIADDEAVLEAALAWLQGRGASRPFFLWVHFLSPHSPYTYREVARRFYDPSYAGPFLTTTGHKFEAARPEDLSRIRDLYDGEVFFADGLFRRTVAALDELGMAGRTLVVLTADHGEEFMEHGRLQHSQVYGEVTHIPLVLLHPTRPAPRRVATPVSNVDLFPTLVASLGVAVPPGLDGVAVDHGAPSDRVILSTAMTAPDERILAVVRGRRKEVLDCGSGTRRLFDLATDAGERRDVSKQRPGETEELLREAESAMGGKACPVIKAAISHPPVRPGLRPETRAGLVALGYLDGGDEGVAALGTDPDPVPLCSPSGMGRALVWWRMPAGAQEAEVRVGSPTGPLFAKGGVRGRAATGNWVKRGTVFFLVDPARNAVVARHAVDVVTTPCFTPAPGADPASGVPVSQ